MMKYRALLLDIDGTIIGKDYKILLKVKEAVVKAKEKVLVSLCSQRQYPAFEDYVKELGLQALQIACGGAQVVDSKTGNEVWGKRINEGTVREIYRELISRGEAVFLNDREFVYIDGREAGYDGYPVPLLPVGALGDWSQILQMGVDGISEKSWRWLEKQDNIYAVRVVSKEKHQGMESYVSITAHGVSKQRGLLEYCRLSKIKPEEIIAVGDDLNDYPMLMAAGLKIAMASAPEELRAIADFVCPPVEENGVATVVEKFIL